MFIKTVSTTSGINPIKFDETGGVFYWILNTGSSTVYASTKSDFSAGDDGVVSLGPKESRRLETNNDTIYILGEGRVEIHNQRDGICSFKQAPTSSGGGETIDAYTKTESDAKYAAKSDVPDAYTKTESDDKYAQKTDVVPYKMGMDFSVCTTAAEKVIKIVTTLHKVAPALGAVFAVKFKNAVPAQAILNINGLTGYIQYRGGSIPNGVINAGDIATFMYHSSGGVNCFEILSIENGGNAKTVNGFTVGCNVPADAAFTPPDLSGYAKLTDIPSSLPANGGNADTVDGKHASEFAASLTNLQFGSNRIEIPDGVNVGEWLVENAKSGNLYFIASRANRTNLPNASSDWMWFSYDGNRYFARAWTGNTDTTEYILKYVNGVGEWKEIYTSDNKPYVTGTVTTSYGGKASVSFGFTPSMVLYRPANPKSNIPGSIYEAIRGVDANGFIPDQSTYKQEDSSGFVYIAFK